MTPTEALDQALDELPVLTAADILAALDAHGYTVARKDDAADGEALRELREALPPEGREWSIAHLPLGGASLRVWSTGGPASITNGVGATIAEAVRAAREALR